MKHPLLQTLLEDEAVAPIGPDGLGAFLENDSSRLNVVFLAGDPQKKLETADVAVVLMELLKAYPGALRVGVVEPEAEKDVMDALAVFALPSLIFLSGSQKLETIPKIQDWSVYAEALPRLIANLREEAPA